MPVFQYVALDSQGVEVKDEIEALSEKEAISKIRNMGYFPTKVRPKAAAKRPRARRAAKPKRRRGAGAKVKVKHVTQFARQLSTLQDAGLPILRSLRILEEQQKAATSSASSGTWPTTSKAARRSRRRWPSIPRAFDRLFVNMVAAGRGGRRARPDPGPYRGLQGEGHAAEGPRQGRDDLSRRRDDGGVWHRAGPDEVRDPDVPGPCCRRWSAAS